MIVSTPDTGQFGTATTPKLVYVSLGPEGSVSMSGSFAGHGTLVIDSTRNNLTPALDLAGMASWNGLILINFAGEAEVAGGSLVRMAINSKVVGGLSMMFNAEAIELKSGGRLIQTSESAAILYSSELISFAPGTGGSVTSSVDVVSYVVR
jgi:hypothetical protein